MSKFLRHDRCPECGSKDNLAVYEDHSYCFTPNCNYTSGSNMDTTKNIFLKGEIPKVLLVERKLSEETIKTYQVVQRVIDGTTAVSFPYYHNGSVVAVKNRMGKDHIGNQLWSSKKYWFEGSASLANLFGVNTMRRRNQIIITEGEMDAMAAYEMYGQKYDCVSVAKGSNSAKDCLIKAKNLLEKYNEVVLCFDNDNAGAIATQDAKKALPTGKVRIATLPQGYKDPCDMLIEGKDEEFRHTINSAQIETPEGVLDKQALLNGTLEYLFNKEIKSRIGTGFPELDEVCGGLRGGELYTLVAGTGTGKSTFAFNLAYNAVKAKTSTLFVPLEMVYPVVCARFAEMDLEQKLITTGDNAFIDIKSNREKITKSLEETLDYLHVFKHEGALTTQYLISSMEFYCRAYGVKFIVLDHIHAAVNTGGEYTYQAIDFLVAELKRVSIQNDCCVFALSHMSRDNRDPDDNKPSLHKIRGSHGIAQNSDLVLGMSRPRDTNQAVFETLKPHRIFGISKTFILNFNQDSMKFKEQNYINEKISERIREGDSGEEYRPDLRTNQNTVYDDVHPRLAVDNQEREGDICRVEGNSDRSGQSETKESEILPPPPRLEDTFPKTKKQDKEG